jgi:hypothetical protein
MPIRKNFQKLLFALAGIAALTASTEAAAQTPCRFIGPNGGLTFVDFGSMGWFTRADRVNGVVGGPFRIRGSVVPPRQGCGVAATVPGPNNPLNQSLPPLAFDVERRGVETSIPLGVADGARVFYLATDDLSDLDQTIKPASSPCAPALCVPEAGRFPSPSLETCGEPTQPRIAS